MARKAWLVAAAVAAVVVADPALACKGSKVLLEDNFSVADPAWDTGDAVIENGALTITPKADHGYSVIYMGDVFPQADICVDIAVPQARNPRDEYLSAGILFMAVDYGASHYFWHSPAAGYLGVSRLVGGKWTNPVPPRQFAMNKQVGATNTLRVTFGGGRGTIYINDRKVVDFRAQESNRAEYFGLRADSEEKAQNAWKFSNVKITDTPK
jgi:hypothetical protein